MIQNVLIIPLNYFFQTSSRHKSVNERCPVLSKRGVFYFQETSSVYKKRCPLFSKRGIPINLQTDVSEVSERVVRYIRKQSVNGLHSNDCTSPADSPLWRSFPFKFGTARHLSKAPFPACLPFGPRRQCGAVCHRQPHVSGTFPKFS